MLAAEAQLSQLGDMSVLPNRDRIARAKIEALEKDVGETALRMRTPNPLSSSPWFAHIAQSLPDFSCAQSAGHDVVTGPSVHKRAPDDKAVPSSGR